jgi:hypothetical protein
MPNPFEQEPLWNKAKLFMERGLTARADGRDEEWPLWASLAAELLGKSVLAKRHPVLVAHPGTGDDAANSLLFAAGIETKEGGLQSIQMKTVLSRLTKVLHTDFDSRVQKDLRVISDLRNEELHSGATPYTGLKEHVWAPGFWRAIDILLRDLGKSVKDFVGPQFEPLVAGLIAATKEEIHTEVNKQFGLAKEKWKVRSADGGGEEVYRNTVNTRTVARSAFRSRLAQCPVCGCKGHLRQGDSELSSVRRVEEDSIIVESRFRTETFDCDGCSLHLDGTAYLAKAGLPVDVTIIEELDPSRSPWEEEYGNC